MTDILGVLLNADGTPVFNSTAQIYQIILQFLIFIVNFFTMLGIFWIVIANGVLDRVHEKRMAKKAQRDAARKPVRS